MALAAVTSLDLDCFHCGLPVPATHAVRQALSDQTLNFCCPGCAAVASAIHGAGLDNYYSLRSEKGLKANAEALEEDFDIYDHPAVQQSFVRKLDGATKEAALVLQGITCAACVWLNEKHLSSLEGVESVDVNYSNHQALVRWDDTRIKLSDILREITCIGYTAHPYDPNHRQALLNHERKQFLRRIGVAAALGMQVMILSVALYAGDWWGMESDFRDFFQRICLLLTTGVLVYSGRTFFSGAWRDLRIGHLGMDVPIALGLSIAFVASTWATLSGSGKIYFDSVVMFVLLVLAARYVELNNRMRAASIIDRKIPLLPSSATRIDHFSNTEHHSVIPCVELHPGNRILVKPGEVIAADGIIMDGTASIDESILTGESLPVARSLGEKVIAGSVNIDSPIKVEVTNVGQDTVLSDIERLLQRAQNGKSKFTQLTDQIAGYFVAGVMSVAGFVASYWLWQGSDIWLQATIAVLIVSCPCALSLATPAAMSAATSRALKNGILITREHALEALQAATHFVFDKTGTLTKGSIVLDSIELLANTPDQRCLDIAAALERNSEHPLAKAIVTRVGMDSISLVATDITNTPGEGMTGKIAGRAYIIGKPSFVLSVLDRTGDFNAYLQDERTTVMLAVKSEPLCLFRFQDEVRPETEQVVRMLKNKNKVIAMLTGDRQTIADKVANSIGIETVYADHTPVQKLEVIDELNNQSAKTAMIGDGINDAPVMGGASVSIAMSDTANITSANADILLINKDLSSLVQALELASKTNSVIRQNMVWAIAYNIIAIPLAAIGYVPPWAAAIGMSVSSAFVILNSSRLLSERSV